MAKKRKHTKRRTTHRRRGMGAISPTLMNAAYAIIGGAVGQLLDQVVANVIPSDFLLKNPKALPYIKAGVPILSGYFLPKFLKNDMGRYGGLGMMTLGGVRLLGAFGVIQALNGVDTPYYNTPMLAAAMQFDQGYQAPMLAGRNPAMCM
jgi:hypothetical protein